MLLQFSRSTHFNRLQQQSSSLSCEYLNCVFTLNKTSTRWVRKSCRWVCQKQFFFLLLSARWNDTLINLHIKRFTLNQHEIPLAYIPYSPRFVCTLCNVRINPPRLLVEWIVCNVRRKASAERRHTRGFERISFDPILLIKKILCAPLAFVHKNQSKKITFAFKLFPLLSLSLLGLTAKHKWTNNNKLLCSDND